MNLLKLTAGERSVFRLLFAQRDRSRLPTNTASRAAQELGLRPKQMRNGRRLVRRVWTGCVEGRRVWRGRLVVLPNRHLAEVVQVVRGRAIVLTNEVAEDGSRIFQYVPAAVLRLFKLAAAVEIGQRKRGVRERKSALKAETARRNGKMPPGPGRRRGRPKKRNQPSQADTSSLDEMLHGPIGRQSDLGQLL